MPFDDITLITISVSAIAIIISGYVALSKRNVTRRGQMSNSVLDVLAVVKEFSQRTARLESRLVDQNVRFEILELRLSRLIDKRAPKLTGLDNPIRLSEDNQIITEKPIQEKNTSLGEQKNERKLIRKKEIGEESGRNPANIDKKILRLVMDGKGYVSDIQASILRSREHTARKMNSLFVKGLVTRNMLSRPFFYTITDDGKKFVNL